MKILQKKELTQYYNKIKLLIKSRLDDFISIGKNGSEQDLFAELCFCLCTPQSRAELAEKAIASLVKDNILFNGNYGQIRNKLRGVRFPNNKAGYILEAREFFKEKDKINIRKYINYQDLKLTRDWFVLNVKGFGYKEASHFLRNIGLGKDFAILDKHILKNMKDFQIIEEIPKTLTRNKYLLLEEKLKNFSQQINIELQELDFVFWSRETGVILK
jgi:N-glycosylase/DNA lyase